MADLDLETTGLTEQQLLDSISNGDSRASSKVLSKVLNGGYTYIVTGDSTRKNNYNNMEAYYNEMLSQINVDVVMDARSGITPAAWLANTHTDSSLQHAIDNTSGTGETTVMEFSLGVNGPEVGFEDTIKDCINAYLAAKPDATVILVTPVKYSTLPVSLNKAQIFISIAEEMGLTYADGYYVTSLVYGDSDYYTDTIHPNENGSKRLLNYILSETMPQSILSALTLSNNPPATPPSGNVSNTLVTGQYWDLSDGVQKVSTDWRSLEPIDVEPNFSIIITTQGNYAASRFNAQPILDDNGDLFGTTVAAKGEGTNEYVLTMPVGGATFLLNIANDGATYDALGETITIRYQVSDIDYMTQQDINKDVAIRMPIVQKAVGLVDSNGSTGTAGQVATAQGLGRWLWKYTI